MVTSSRSTTNEWVVDDPDYTGFYYKITAVKLYELVTRDWMWTLTIKSEKRRKELRELRISSVSIVEMCDQGGATSLPVLINGKLPRIVLDEAGVTYPYSSRHCIYVLVR